MILALMNPMRPKIAAASFWDDHYALAILMDFFILVKLPRRSIVRALTFTLRRADKGLALEGTLFNLLTVGNVLYQLR